MKLIPAMLAILYFAGCLLFLGLGVYWLSVAGVPWANFAPAILGVLCFIVGHALFKMAARSLYKAGT